MTSRKSAPVPRFTVITLGVSDMKASIAFYTALGFERRSRATGEAVAFFDTGGSVIALFPWDQACQGRRASRTTPTGRLPRRHACLELQVDCGGGRGARRLRLSKGASLLKAAHKTVYGGYSGYFLDPDGHPWEVVVAPGIEVGDDRRVHLPD